MSVSVFKAHASTPVAASTTSTNVQLTGVTTGLRVVNTNTSVAWLAFGADNTVAASVPADKTTTAQIAIAAGATEVFRRDKAYEKPWAAVILESGSGKVIFTEGEGA